MSHLIDHKIATASFLRIGRSAELCSFLSVAWHSLTCVVLVFYTLFVWLACDSFNSLPITATGHWCGSRVVHVFLQLRCVSLMWSVHALKNFFHSPPPPKERPFWNPLLRRVWGVLEGHHIEENNLVVLEEQGLLTLMEGWQRYFVPGVIFIIWRLCSARKTKDHLPAHCKAQLRSVFVTQTHALSTFLCPVGKHRSPGQMKTSTFSPTFSVGKMSWNQS